jgi:hypothetical protein
VHKKADKRRKSVQKHKKAAKAGDKRCFKEITKNRFYDGDGGHARAVYAM